MAGYLLCTYPQPRVDAVDIDRHAVELGARWCGLAPHPRLRVHIDDGWRWLRGSAERFDIVMLDAYDDRPIPAAMRRSFNWIEAYAFGDSLVLVAGRGAAPPPAAAAMRANALDRAHPAAHPLAELLARRTTLV